MAATLSEIVSFLDQELRTAEIPDYPGAINGLQLANSGQVPRIVAAVDASLPVIEEAVEAGAGLLIVHHGMFWQGVQPVTQAFYRKLKIAMDADLAIYSSHLPLDVHPVWGNNIRLAEELGLLDTQPFFQKNGTFLGVRGEWNGDRNVLAARLGQAVDGPVHACLAGTVAPRVVGIITGGAGSEVAQVAAAGIDTFVTGEGPHWSYPLAEELNINVFYAGHYATETFGVKACAAALADRYGLSWEFIHHPTGL
jgi:dinuclear metal center YbgI/SA1388 family protein